jgi:hypothetical protein
MNSVSVPAATVPAPRLRARPVNTSHVVTTKASTKTSVTKRVASPKSSTVRPRSTTTAAAAPLTSSSVTRRARSNVKPVAPGRPPASAVDESGSSTAVVAGAPLTPIPTSTSHLSSHGKATHPPATSSVTLKKTSRNAKLAATTTTTTAALQHNSRHASRLDSVCSSLLGSSDRGSLHRLRVHPQNPPVPHIGQVTRVAPLTRAATAECVLRSARQPTAPEVQKKSPPPPPLPESHVCSRTQSAHDVLELPLSPRRATDAAVSGRTFGSAAASRVSSVNSRLAEAKPAASSRAQRTHVVRTAGKRSAAHGGDATAAASADACSPSVVPAAFAAVPPRTAGLRPLLPASRRLAQKENATGTVGASRLRNASLSGTAAAAVVGHAETGETRFSRAAASRQAPLSGRRAAGASPSRKTTRKNSDAVHSQPTTTTDAALPPPPSSKFQQTHTGCPPPLSFGGSVRGSGHKTTTTTTAAQPRGPVSPIKRISTACPSSAQVYPVAALPEDDASRDSASIGAVAPDSAFASPWLKPGAFSTPTNRDGGRESSEAPTVPYEGSTGQRASMSLSPRTDLDSASVSGRLSYGV